MNLVNPQYYGALKSINAAGEYFAGVLDKINEGIKQLDEREAKVGAIEQAIAAQEAVLAEKLRVGQLDLSLQIKADKDAAFVKLAKELNRVNVTEADYAALLAASTKSEADVEKAVAIERNRVISTAKNEAAQAESAHKLSMAKLEAELSQAQSQVTFYQTELDRLREELSAVRDNALKMVEAANRGSIVVNAPTGKN